MCYISGANFDSINSVSEALRQHINALNKDSNLRHDDKIDSTFFHLRIFKKGTVHIEFRDFDLLDEVNRRSTQGKKWVPDQSSATQQSKRKSNKLAVIV